MHLVGKACLMTLSQDSIAIRIIGKQNLGFKLCILIEISDVMLNGPPLSSGHPKAFVSIFETLKK